MTPQVPRLCIKCGDEVYNHQPALITSAGTAHIGGCDPGAVEATNRMKAAFAAVNSAKVSV